MAMNSNSVRVLLQAGLRPCSSPAGHIGVPCSRNLFYKVSHGEVSNPQPKSAQPRSSSPSSVQYNSTLPLNQSYAPSPAPRPAFDDVYDLPKVVQEPPPSELGHSGIIIGRDGKPIQIRSIPKMAGVFGSDPLCMEHLPKLDVRRFRNTEAKASPLSTYSYQRKVKMDKLSKYMTLISPVTEDDACAEARNKEFKNLRPLVLLYPWLMAEEKHVNKYTRIYTDLGIDVLKVRITPLDLLRPEPRAQKAAKEVLEYLLANTDWHKLFIHGMSVGAYGFMEVMTKMEAHEDRYLGIRPRFIGQVWDSPCDLPGLKEGVSRSITENRILQMKIMNALDWFLTVRYDAATRHYIKTQDMYHKNYCRAPALFLYSRADPVSAAQINTNLANWWHKFGFDVYARVFHESGHVGHYPKYKADYTAYVHAFLHRIGLLRYAGINIDE